MRSLVLLSMTFTLLIGASGTWIAVAVSLALYLLVAGPVLAVCFYAIVRRKPDASERAGFYWLLERMLARMSRRRAVILPADVHMQPVDSDEFADFIVDALSGERRGAREDFVGPQTLTMRELAEQYLAARGLDRRVWNAPLPRRVKLSLEAGNTSPHALHGTTTWSEWLAPS